jgi:hypothetical protein
LTILVRGNKDQAREEAAARAESNNATFNYYNANAGYRANGEGIKEKDFFVDEGLANLANENDSPTLFPLARREYRGPLANLCL